MIEKELKKAFDSLGWIESDDTGFYLSETIIFEGIGNTIAFGGISLNQNFKEVKREYIDGSIQYLRSAPDIVSQFHHNQKYMLIRHNLAGPAVIFPDGTVEYWVSGLQLTEENFNIIKNYLLLE